MAISAYTCRACRASDAGLATFGSRTGTQPNVAAYYSGWLEPFQSRFAGDVSARGTVPLVQIDPSGTDLAAITHGQYNSYLESYATAVRDFGHPVIISFGDEMNGSWYSWGNGKPPPRCSWPPGGIWSSCSGPGGHTT